MALCAVLASLVVPESELAYSGPVAASVGLFAAPGVVMPSPEPTGSPEPTLEPTPTPTAKPTPSPTPLPTSTPSLQDRVREEWARQGLSNGEEAVWCVDNETGGKWDNPHSESKKYHGYWQANEDFYGTYNGGVDPHTQEIEGQTAMAVRGYKERGWRPWPACRRRFGDR